MKNKILFLTASFPLFALASPDPQQPTHSPDGDEVVLRPTTPPDFRPNSLEEDNSIICIIFEKHIEFILPASVDFATVSIYNDKDGRFDLITHQENVIFYSFSKGTYFIECFTNNGTTYSGEIQFY